jgi:hypothetical protein
VGDPENLQGLSIDEILYNSQVLEGKNPGQLLDDRVAETAPAKVPTQDIVAYLAMTRWEVRGTMVATIPYSTCSLISNLTANLF